MERTLVVGLGSCHGDDGAAWKLLEMIGPHVPFEMLALAEPSRLLDHLEGLERLVLIDTVQSGRSPGTILRLIWPDALIETTLGKSSHGLGVGGVLALADRLGRLPPHVVVLAIEEEVSEPGQGLSPAVAGALPGLRERLFQEVSA